LDVLCHSLVYIATSNMFIGKLFVVINVLFCFTLACHSKGNKKDIEEISQFYNICNFINVSDSHDLSYQKHGYIENPISRKKYVFSMLRSQISQHFHATKIKSNFFNSQMI